MYCECSFGDRIMAHKKEEQIQLDQIKVLNALEQHSKDSINEIAKSCGFSHQKVWRIIKNLEKNKVIWGYPPVVDEQTISLKHFTLLVKRTIIPFDDDIRKEVILDKLDNKISGLVKIENIYATQGISDFIFTFYAPTLVSAKKFVNQLFERHTNYIKEYFLLETLVHLRKQGLKNPQLKHQANYF
jgi:Lrp/AsnC family transcriptional regulator, leucine-responsive regulatory protein